MPIYDDISEKIQQLVLIDKSSAKSKKELIQKIAKDIDKAIQEKNPRILNQFKMIGKEPEQKNIAYYLNRIREDKELSFKSAWLYKCLDGRYKTERDTKGSAPTVRLTQNYVNDHIDELKEMLKEATKGPAKDIKVKIKKDEIDTQGWNNIVAFELVQLAKKLEEDKSDVDPDFLKEIALRIKMVKDARFATTWARYEAISVAVNCSKSLTKALEDEKHNLSRDELNRNEKNCRECYCQGSPKPECKKCHCHRMTQDMTTKGWKWAKKHNRPLAEFDEHFAQIGNMDNEDLCPHIKALFTNPNMNKFVNQEDKLDMFHKHIDGKDGCVKCDLFYQEHPDFFKTDK